MNVIVSDQCFEPAQRPVEYTTLNGMLSRYINKAKIFIYFEENMCVDLLRAHDFILEVKNIVDIIKNIPYSKNEAYLAGSQLQNILVKAFSKGYLYQGDKFDKMKDRANMLIISNDYYDQAKEYTDNNLSLAEKVNTKTHDIVASKNTVYISLSKDQLKSVRKRGIVTLSKDQVSAIRNESHTASNYNYDPSQEELTELKKELDNPEAGFIVDNLPKFRESEQRVINEFKHLTDHELGKVYKFIRTKIIADIPEHHLICECKKVNGYICQTTCITCAGKISTIQVDNLQNDKSIESKLI